MIVKRIKFQTIDLSQLKEMWMKLNENIKLLCYYYSSACTNMILEVCKFLFNGYELYFCITGYLHKVGQAQHAHSSEVSLGVIALESDVSPLFS